MPDDSIDISAHLQQSVDQVLRLADAIDKYSDAAARSITVSTKMGAKAADAQRVVRASLISGEKITAHQVIGSKGQFLTDQLTVTQTVDNAKKIAIAEQEVGNAIKEANAEHRKAMKEINDRNSAYVKQQEANATFAAQQAKAEQRRLEIQQKAQQISAAETVLNRRVQPLRGQLFSDDALRAYDNARAAFIRLNQTEQLGEKDIESLTTTVANNKINDYNRYSAAAINAIRKVILAERRLVEEQQANSRQRNINLGGQLAAGFLRRRLGTVEPGTASIDSLQQHAEAIASLRRLVIAEKTTSADILRINKDVERGKIQSYVGVEAAIQRHLIRVLKAEQRIREEVARTNEERRKTQLPPTDNLNKGLEEAQNHSTKLLVTWEGMARVMLYHLSYRALYAIVGGIRESTQAAQQLQIAMSEIRTITQHAQLDFGQLGRGLRDVSDAWGIDIIDEARSAYEAISNQVVEGAQAFKFLEETSKLAVTTVTTNANAVDLLSSVINSYSRSVEESEAVSATLFKTIDLGRVRADEMANSIGRITVLGAELGVSFEELSSLIATLTIQGVKYSEAATQIRNIFNKLIKPTEEMKDLFASLGVNSGQAAIKTFGFTETLRLIQQYAGDDAEIFGKLFNNVRGLTGVLAVSGPGMQIYEKNLREISDSLGEYRQAVDIAMESSARRVQIETNKVKNYFISTYGDNLIELLAAASDAFGGLDNAVKGATGAIVAFSAVSAVAGARALFVSRSLLTFGPAIVNPWVAAAAAVAVVTGATVTYYERLKSEEEAAQKTFDDAWSRRQETIRQASNSIVNDIKTAFDSAFGDRANRSTELVQSFNVQRDEFLKSFTLLEKEIQTLAADTDNTITQQMNNFQRASEDAKRKISQLKSAGDDLGRTVREQLFQWNLDDLDIPQRVLRLKAELNRLLTLELPIAQRAEDPVQAIGLVQQRYIQLVSQLKSVQDEADTQNKKNAEDRLKIEERIRDIRRDAKEQSIQDNVVILEAERNLKNARGSDQRRQAEEALYHARQQALENERKASLEVTKQQRERRKIASDLKVSAGYQRDLVSGAKRIASSYAEAAKQQENVQKFTARSAEEQHQITLNLALAREAIKDQQFDKIIEIKDLEELNQAGEKRNKAFELYLKYLREAGADKRLIVNLKEQQVAEQSLIADRKENIKIANDSKVLNEERIKQEEAIRKAADDQARAETGHVTRLRNVVSAYEEVLKDAEAAGVQTKAWREEVETALKALDSIPLGQRTLKDYNRVFSIIARQISDNRQRVIDSAIGGPNLDETLPDKFRSDIDITFSLMRRFATRFDATIGTTADAIAQMKQNVIDAFQIQVQEAPKAADAYKPLLDRINEINDATQRLKNNLRDLNTVLPPSAAPTAPGHAAGGPIGRDRYMSWLTPGEFVMNAQATRRNFSSLIAMNSGTRFASGGNVSNVNNVSINLQASGNPQFDAMATVTAIRRELRRGTVKL